MTLSLTDLWARLERGDGLVGLALPGEDLSPMWGAWARCAREAGYRLLYVRQDGSLAKILREDFPEAQIDIPAWGSAAEARLRAILPREGPPVVGIWENATALLHRPDPIAAQEILAALDRLRREAAVIWFFLARWDEEGSFFLLASQPLSTVFMAQLPGPEPAIAVLRVGRPGLPLAPGFYRVALDPPPRLHAVPEPAPGSLAAFIPSRAPRAGGPGSPSACPL